MSCTETIKEIGLPPAPVGYEWQMGISGPRIAHVPILPTFAAPTASISNSQGRAIAGPSTGTKVANRILAIPWGKVRSTNGDFILDAESARMVLDAFHAQRVELPIDYEHQTLHGDNERPDGLAPAAGWIHSLDVMPECGIYADVRWTPKGSQMVAAHEYRYLSPVVMVRKEDGRVSSLHSVALTNRPAIAGATPIVNRQAAIPPTTGAAALACSGQAVATQQPQTPTQVSIDPTVEADGQWQANAQLRAEFGDDRPAFDAYYKSLRLGLTGPRNRQPATAIANSAADTSRPNAPGCYIDPTVEAEGQWQANAQLRAEFGDDRPAFDAYYKALRLGVTGPRNRQPATAIANSAADTSRPNAPGCHIDPTVEAEGQWQANPELRAEFKDDYEAFVAYWQHLRR
jgi:hypothetical protein